MSASLPRPTWRHTLTALGLSLSSSLASAAIYTGSWDPAYGPAFPDLGWRGEVRFFVPDDCLAEGPGLYRESDPGLGGLPTPGWVGACEDSRVLGARVQLYSLADLAETTLHELLFPGFRFDPPDLVAIGLDGEFSGLRTGFAWPPVAVTDPALLGPGTYVFSVRFNKADGLPVGTARLNHFCIADCGGAPGDGASASEPDLAIQRVPAPGTLGLVLAGLLVLGRLGRPGRPGRAGSSPAQPPKSPV